MSRSYELNLVLENPEGKVMHKVYQRITMQRLQMIANEYDGTHKVLSIIAKRLTIFPNLLETVG